MSENESTGFEHLGLTAENEALLLEALELPAEQRQAFIETSTNDPAVRQVIEDLLAAHAESEERLGRLAESLGSELKRDWTREPAPAPGRAGPYRLERELGRGGMSVVYLGCRDDGQFEQTVAVKVLPGGPAARSLAKRFESERRILARLEHPNLARLIDGGISAEGFPFFAMEYVEGLPIDRYCDENRLDVDARLRLFGQVLEAVQYAHANLIVHRDIKPSNILVTAQGRVKLLDFGIAKVLEESSGYADATELTQLSGRPMSPAWASPEQVDGRPVTIGSDVYSLGVLLYKLLTGHLPYANGHRDPARLRSAILHQDPAGPSERVLRTGGPDDEPAPSRIAELRNSQPRRLARRLKGDLDNIVLAALCKEPKRRYATVEQFATDLDRHRQRLPVQARASGWRYRAGRFIRRHPFGVAVSVLAPLVIIGGLLLHAQGLESERLIAQSEAEKATQIAEFLVELFEQADPGQHLGEEITARQLMSLGVQRIERLADLPLVQAELAWLFSRIHQSTSQFDEAEALARQALELTLSLPQADSDKIANTQLRLGETLVALGRAQEAIPLFEQAMALLEPGESSLRVYAHNGLGSAYYNLGSGLDEAGAQFAAAIELAGELPAAKDSDLATAHHNLGTVRIRQGRLQEALQHLETATELRTSLDHPLASISRSTLAHVLRELGEYQQAEHEMLAVLDDQIRVLGPDHLYVAHTMHGLGSLNWSQRHLEEAEHLEKAEYWWGRALETRLRLFDEDHPQIGLNYNSLGLAAREHGDFELAESRFLKAIEILESAHGRNHVTAITPLINLAQLRLRQLRLEESDDLFVEALELLGPAAEHEHLAVARIQAGRAEVQLHRGRFQEALELAVELEQNNRSIYEDSDHHEVRRAEELIARIEAAMVTGQP